MQYSIKQDRIQLCSEHFRTLCVGTPQLLREMLKFECRIQNFVTAFCIIFKFWHSMNLDKRGDV